MRAILLAASVLLTACGGNVLVDPTDGGSSAGCAKCSAVLQGGSLSNVCLGTSVSLYQDMRSCACLSIPCAGDSCNNPGDLCGGSTITAISPDCLSCIVSAPGACGAQIQACQGDL